VICKGSVVVTVFRLRQ